MASTLHIVITFVGANTSSWSENQCYETCVALSVKPYAMKIITDICNFVSHGQSTSLNSIENLRGKHEHSSKNYCILSRL